MKNYTIGFLVLVVIILGFMFMKPKKSTDNGLNNNSSTTTETVTSNTSSSGKNNSTTVVKPTTQLATNLFPKSGNYECKYEQVTGGVQSSNVVYIADGKMRGEFRTKDSKGMATSNIMIYNSPNLYIWVEGKSVGTVTQPKSLKDIPAVIPTDVHEGRVLSYGSNSVSWDCHAWSKVPSMLSKPAYVNFY